MKDTKNEVLELMTNYSVNEERLMCLIQLASYMMGRFNICQGEICGNKEINNNYPAWLESLIDTVSELAQKQVIDFDGIIEKSGHLE